MSMNCFRRRDYVLFAVTLFIGMLASVGIYTVALTSFLIGLLVGFVLLYIEEHGFRVSPKDLSKRRK